MREVRRVLLSGADQLTQLSGRALALGDTQSAGRLAEAALATDPGNMQADIIRSAVKRQTDKADVSGTQFEIQSEGAPTSEPAPDAGAVIEQPLQVVEGALRGEIQDEGFRRRSARREAPVLLVDRGPADPGIR